MGTPIGEISILADQESILAIRMGFGLENPNELTRSCHDQLKEYFLGHRQKFDLPLSFNGTSFQKLVWEELIRVKFGSTLSYSEIAKNIGRPKAQRAVGAANHVNNLPIIVPCHRIVGKNGALVGYALGLDKKAWLLEHEQKCQ